MKDFLGNEINIGDIVVALAHQSTSSCLYEGEIIDVTSRWVVIKVFNSEEDWKLKDIMRVSPCKVVKVS